MQETETNKNYFIGAIGAILGALIGAAPWAVAYSFGWFVGWLGFLIGICAVKGYNIFRGKKGMPAVLIIILSIILGVIAGQVLGDILNIVKYINNGEIEGVSLSGIPNLYLYVLLNDSEFFASFLGNFALGLLFAGLGVWKLLTNMISELKPQKPEVLEEPIENIETEIVEEKK